MHPWNNNGRTAQKPLPHVQTTRCKCAHENVSTEVLVTTTWHGECWRSSRTPIRLGHWQKLILTTGKSSNNMHGGAFWFEYAHKRYLCFWEYKSDLLARSVVLAHCVYDKIRCHWIDIHQIYANSWEFEKIPRFMKILKIHEHSWEFTKFTNI